MALHHQVARLLHEGVFFAHPASPWRGTNENTNGLLRQYLPRRTSLAAYTADDLRAVEERLNSRARKTLGCQTPAAIFGAAVAI
jgi:IS30 family transposase